MTRRRGNLVVLSAPSGTGKSTIVERLLSEMNGLEFSVSATTREPRGAERDGVEYHFLNRSEFEESVAESGFLEHAEVHGNLYGTPRATTEDALARGRDVLLDIDVQGARQVTQSGFPAITIFLLPPSRDELERRLRGRGTESELDLQKRMDNAAQELALAGDFGFAVINDDLEDATERIAGIIEAARSRTAAMGPIISELQDQFGVSD